MYFYCVRGINRFVYLLIAVVHLQLQLLTHSQSRHHCEESDIWDYLDSQGEIGYTRNVGRVWGVMASGEHEILYATNSILALLWSGVRMHIAHSEMLMWNVRPCLVSSLVWLQ